MSRYKTKPGINKEYKNILIIKMPLIVSWDSMQPPKKDDE